MLSKIHNAFPITKKCTYLNTPSSGLTSKKLIDFRKQYDNGIHTDYKKIDFLEDEQIDSLRTKIQKYFKAETAEIALLPSFSIGLNGIVDALPKHAKVLLLKGDYPSVNLPFEFRDFQIEYAEINENLEHNTSFINLSQNAAITRRTWFLLQAAKTATDGRRHQSRGARLRSRRRQTGGQNGSGIAVGVRRATGGGRPERPPQTRRRWRWLVDAGDARSRRHHDRTGFGQRHRPGAHTGHPHDPASGRRRHDPGGTTR